MNQGEFIFAQSFEIVYWYDFNLCVDRYNGNFGVKSFNWWKLFLIMSFAQFNYRESLRDIEYCFEIVSTKLYYCGIKTPVFRNTFAEANRDQNWMIYADYAQVLIDLALPHFYI